MAAIKRMHVAVNCSDLNNSLAFYRSFFGAEPTKVKENYAKFEFDNPATVQDKVWVYDPDGNAWEIFYTKEDSEVESAGDARDLSLCCVPPAAPVAVEFTSFRKNK